MSADWRQANLPAGVTHRVFLVRHGETDASSRGRCYGKLDVALSEHGLEQIRRTANLLAPLQPDCIYSSPRIRALDSAALVADTCRLQVFTEPDLAELDFGDFEGMRYEDVERDWPEFYADWMQHPTSVTFPGGESYSSMATRVVRRFAELVSINPDTKMVLLAHGGVIRIILAEVLGLDPEAVFRLDQSYSAVSCIDFYGDTPIIRVMNWLP